MKKMLIDSLYVLHFVMRNISENLKLPSLINNLPKMKCNIVIVNSTYDLYHCMKCNFLMAVAYRGMNVVNILQF
jgi:hypothetical protein